MSPDFFEPKPGKLATQVTSGVAATGVSQAVRVLCQMGSVVVLSRMLSPSAFGIVAMASPVFGLVTLFQDLGLGQAMVQKKVVTHDEVNALFWVNICVGAVLGVVLIVAAPLAGWFYKDHHVTALLVAMSAIVLMSMFASQHYTILTRRMEFIPLAVLDAASAIVSLVAAIVWAFFVPNFWALYVSMVASALLTGVATWIMSGWRPEWPPKFHAAKHMLHFGAGLTGFNLSNFFARNLDNALIGHRWGDVPLGLYDRAYKLLLFPLQQVTNPVAKVMVPALSRLQNEPERYESAFLKAQGMILLVTIPGVVFMTLTAPTLIPFILGAKWSGATPIFQALGVAGLIQVLNNPTGWLFISQGRTKLFAVWGIVTGITSALAFILGLPYGPVGVAIAYAVSEYLRTPVLWWLVTKEGPLSLKKVLSSVFPVYLGAGLALFTLSVSMKYLSTLSALPLLVLFGVASYAIILAITAIFPQGRVLFNQPIAIVKNLMQKFSG